MLLFMKPKTLYHYTECINRPTPASGGGGLCSQIPSRCIPLWAQLQTLFAHLARSSGSATGNRLNGHYAGQPVLATTPVKKWSILLKVILAACTS